MTECFFGNPEDIEGRKNLRDFTYSDVFPSNQVYLQTHDTLFPDKVTNIVHQLRAQQHLRENAAIVNQQIKEMKLNSPPMTDDQLRAQKIKERMMKRKQSSSK